ncbi:hypothetical protein P0082_05695 [Candidatus Haliotispira prima]|uniref:Tetratricopeptide repeat protein n=1 Tax=Candidatus Haliotispira prima TaxID=3034016 RepID=A0ABY8MK54_9SPIO|nr:hypothetical protein P0082_05695 [Candidatus Haliotispira prima]
MDNMIQPKLSRYKFRILPANLPAAIRAHCDRYFVRVMRSRRFFLRFSVLSLLSFTALLSCAGSTPTDPASSTELSPTTNMLQLLNEPQRWQQYGSEERLAMYNNVLQFYRRADTEAGDGGAESFQKNKSAVFRREIQRLDDIFLSHISTNPQDIYNSYYLYNIAGHYIERGEGTMGLWLLRSMYRQFPDLKHAQYPSIHYLILDTLGRMERNVDYRIDAIRQILSNYELQPLTTDATDNSNTGHNDRGIWLYRLGKAYETKATKLLYIDRELADQQLRAAMDLYGRFSRLNAVTVPEERNARNIVASKINIYNARRNWYTDPNLENLIRKIKSAIQRNDVGATLYYQANSFFVLSADYRDEVRRSGTNIYLPHFLGGIIQFGDLTPESNDEEAWLYSTNWPFHLTTWYLYFHKIHYPAKPEIDGNWEWAGIYLGDFY